MEGIYIRRQGKSVRATAAGFMTYALALARIDQINHCTEYFCCNQCAIHSSYGSGMWFSWYCIREEI